MAEALFACTKCYKRFPLNKLSKDQQICSKCSITRQRQCKYCRNDYKPKRPEEDRCSKCIEQEAKHGEPKECEICRLQMAFKISLCVRCYHYRKTCGEPVQCVHCKQRCAFRRDPSSLAKVGGHLLCWLCTYAYKKGRGQLEEELAESALIRKRAQLFVTSEDTDDDIDALLDSQLAPNKQTSGPAASGATTVTSSSSNLAKRLKTTGGGGGVDRSLLDLTPRILASGSAGGHSMQEPIGRPSTPTSHPVGYRFEPPSDQMALINQLQEEVKSFKKQVSQKEAQLLEKERKITELKAEHYESDKQWRKKEDSTAKKYQMTIDVLNSKLREANRWIAQQNKSTSSMKRSASALTLANREEQDSSTSLFVVPDTPE